MDGVDQGRQRRAAAAWPGPGDLRGRCDRRVTPLLPLGQQEAPSSLRDLRALPAAVVMEQKYQTFPLSSPPLFLHPLVVLFTWEQTFEWKRSFLKKIGFY